MRLTDISVKALKPPHQGQKFYPDDTLPGFGVRVSQGGSKTFTVLHGRTRSRHTIGRYPILSLADAREEAKKVIAKLTLGTYQAPSDPYDRVKAAYLKACEEKNRPRTVRAYSRLLAHFTFGSRRIGTISKRDVTAKLDKIAAPSERAHAQVAIKVFFSWCADRGYIDASPITALKAVSKKERKPKRALSTEELKEVLSKALKAPYPFGHIVALLLLTGQRRNEVATMAWDRITFDTITIPGEIAKNHVTHIFPYGIWAQQVLDSIPSHYKQQEYVFPASRDHVRGVPCTVFNGWGKAKEEFDATLENVAPYKLHDLRRTFTTHLQKLGVQLEVREKLTNHISGTQSGVAGIYNVYEYEDEMKDAVALYDSYLTQLLAA